ARNRLPVFLKAPILSTRPYLLISRYWMRSGPRSRGNNHRAFLRAGVEQLRRSFRYVMPPTRESPDTSRKTEHSDHSSKLCCDSEMTDFSSRLRGGFFSDRRPNRRSPISIAAW